MPPSPGRDMPGRRRNQAQRAAPHTGPPPRPASSRPKACELKAASPRPPIPPLRMYNHPAADLEVNKNVLSISYFH